MSLILKAPPTLNILQSFAGLQRAKALQFSNFFSSLFDLLLLLLSASMSMLIKNMTFKAGQTLTVVGVVKPDPKRFDVNIGPSEDRIALHFNPRFNANGDINTIVCNSFEGGNWCQEQRETRFPFSQGQEFKIVIKFTLSEFVVTLPCGSTFCFPNRIGAEKYSIMSFNGDAAIRSIEIQ